MLFLSVRVLPRLFRRRRELMAVRPKGDIAFACVTSNLSILFARNYRSFIGRGESFAAAGWRGRVTAVSRPRWDCSGFSSILRTVGIVKPPSPGLRAHRARCYLDVEEGASSVNEVLQAYGDTDSVNSNRGLWGWFVTAVGRTGPPAISSAACSATGKADPKTSARRVVCRCSLSSR